MDIVPLANEIIAMYLNNEIDELIIIYNHYINSLTNEIHKERILPISKKLKAQRVMKIIFF
ncbi:MAG: F0F1 ATP synthase subunit gamma [Clostridium sp.]|nr:MAG: F0F1 ATP synthase subunit gamma [Clostridium sp.]